MRNPHLTDDRLIDVCLDRAPSASEQQHLSGCESCRERRDSLARVLDDTSEVAAAEADVLFTEERLSRQRAHILQRVEQESRHGQLIAFPAGKATSPVRLRIRPASRWIAGAAAAGLFIGMLAGHLTHDFTAGRVLPNRAAATMPAATIQAVSTTLSEEEFLGQIELAIEGTGGSALRPLDDLTPLVWEVAAQ
jgi:predicted anti-sigma-YlaC factor YlaD